MVRSKQISLDVKKTKFMILHHKQRNIENLSDKLQKSAVRIVTCIKYNTHAESLLSMLNLLKIEDTMKKKH